MALSADLLQLISILENEGFGSLAGRLLTEISLGRLVERQTRPAIKDEHANDSVVERAPIPEADQLEMAIRLLGDWLIEPARAFAEAERIAGELSGAPAVRIRFIDPDRRTETEPLGRDEVGRSQPADRFDELLHRLPQMFTQGTSRET